MSNNLYFAKLHAELLDIMDEVDRVCQRNNLRYYLVGGSLLGAVRHKGFIPWDDDLDIAMPREDYERFMELSSSELHPSYEIDWISDHPEYWLSFFKVCRKETVFLQQEYNRPFKIFVDVFPLDYGPVYCRRLELIKKMGGYLHAVSTCKVVNKVTWKTYLWRFIRLLISNTAAHKLTRRLRMYARKLGESHFVNFASQYKLSKQTMPVEWYGEGVPVEFEGRRYIAPSEYIRVLTSIYGENYMQLPSEDKRRTHYPVRVVFSNGEVMEFERTEKIVKAEM